MEHLDLRYHITMGLQLKLMLPYLTLPYWPDWQHIFWHSLCCVMPRAGYIIKDEVYWVKVIIRKKKDFQQENVIFNCKKIDERFTSLLSSRLYVLYYLERCLRWDSEISGLYRSIILPLSVSILFLLFLALALFRLQGCWKKRRRKACKCH